MGIASKLATKARTATKATPVSLPTPWRDAGELHVAAVVRAAAATIACSGAKSSGFVGSDFLGINQGRHEAPSDVWVHRLSDFRWLISLGRATSKGPVYDWQVLVQVDDETPGRQQLTLSTPNVLTNDGALVNHKAHAELRELLTTSLAEGHRPTGSAESAASKASLPSRSEHRTAQHPPGGVSTAEVLATLSRDQVAQALALVPFPEVSVHGEPAAWSLWSSGSVATVDLVADGSRIRLRATCTVASSGNPTADLIAGDRAYAFPYALLRAVRTLDADATMVDAAGAPA